jgi:hypothetical protein
MVLQVPELMNENYNLSGPRERACRFEACHRIQIPPAPRSP